MAHNGDVQLAGATGGPNLFTPEYGMPIQKENSQKNEENMRYRRYRPNDASHTFPNDVRSFVNADDGSARSLHLR